MFCRIVIESSGGKDLVPCICSEEPVGDWLADLQERLYWNVSKTANSINPLLHNTLDPCATVEESLTSARRKETSANMSKSSSSASLSDLKNGFNEKLFRPSQETVFVMDNKSYSILDQDSHPLTNTKSYLSPFSAASVNNHSNK